MAITVPAAGQPITVEAFGGPVANQINTFLADGTASKVFYIETAGMSGNLAAINTYYRIWSYPITIAASDLKNGLCLSIFACTYFPPTPVLSYGLSCGFDNARVGVGVGGSTAAGPMGPTAFGITPAITVAGNHTVELWLNQSITAYNVGGSALMATLLTRR